MKEMNEWVGKRVKIFIRNLNEKPIVYTGTVLSVNETLNASFLTIADKNNNTVTINHIDIVQIKEVVQNDEI